MNEEHIEPIKLDEGGIPILDEVISEGSAGADGSGTSSDHKIEVDIQRLARSIAADVAIELARELEVRIIKELAPLLEKRMQEMLTSGQEKSDNPSPQQ